MIRLNVNGDVRDLDVQPDVPLLWVLRETLGLTGAKFGCGRGLCGACTVHLDGQAVRSCLVPVGAAADGGVTTIEGLARDGQHPVVQAWIAEQVPQCGYCQPGQIMSAAALLQRNPNPDETAIAAAMRGNICRCGTYVRIRRAVRRASQLASSRTG